MFSQIKFILVSFIAFFSSLQAFGSFSADMEEGGFVGPDAMNTEVSCRMALAPSPVNSRIIVEIQSGGVWFHREALVTERASDGTRSKRLLVKRERLKVGYRYVSREENGDAVFALSLNLADPVRPGLFEGQAIMGGQSYVMLCRQLPTVTAEAGDISAE